MYSRVSFVNAAMTFLPLEGPNTSRREQTCVCDIISLCTLKFKQTKEHALWAHINQYIQYNYNPIHYSLSVDEYIRNKFIYTYRLCVRYYFKGGWG